MEIRVLYAVIYDQLVTQDGKGNTIRVIRLHRTRVLGARRILLPANRVIPPTCDINSNVKARLLRVMTTRIGRSTLTLRLGRVNHDGVNRRICPINVIVLLLVPRAVSGALLRVGLGYKVINGRRVTLRENVTSVLSGRV